MDKRVSVIVPVYNVEKYLKKCVNSIIKQTYKNLEIILVDDGSPDRSGALCDHLATKDSRIRVIHQANGGVSSARNAGIEAATGEYICFVDSDDWLSEHAIEILARRMKGDSSDLCIGAVTLVGIRGSSSLCKISNTIISQSDIQSLLEYDALVRAPWSKLFKADIIRQNSLRFPQGVAYGEDAIFVWQYLSYCNRISTSDVQTYYYSQLNAQNASTKYYSDFADWQSMYIATLEHTINISCLSMREKRKTVCQTVLRYTYFCGCVYAQHLGAAHREELLERLRYTVNLFRDYLYDDTLELSAGMEKEQEILRSYIFPEDYDGLADYFMRRIQNSKMNIVQQAIRRIALFYKRKWIYG